MGVPRSTYRVQVRPGFDLDATAELSGYLAALGVTHLYSAPLLQATPGSAHGYDVVDHSRVNAELGGRRGLERLVAALREHNLGLVVDIVPNHAGVAVPAANPAWWDVLRLGPGSPYAGWFDIDWSRGPLLIPVLADSPDALDDLRVADGELRYHERRYPLAPGTGDGSPGEVHERQHYRLVSWRRANTEISYRRFFAVSDLAALQVEDPAVFAATHGEVFRWCAEYGVAGIRVDHPDGLRDPAGYLARLRASVPDAWLVVEKILERGEQLAGWPVAGTTGYEALGMTCGLFLDGTAEPAFTTLDTQLTGAVVTWPDLVHDSKLGVATTMLRAELRRLARLVEPGSALAVEETLAELLACFGVYRSYLPIGADHLAAAAVAVRRRRPDLAATLDGLLPRLSDPADELAIRFQQTSGAVMAKGLEDTAFYRWTRFVALNEVGGDPARFGVSPADFHAFCAARHERWPHAMTTLSTHDTKRSEDVRARLAVLTEMPVEWAAAVRRWMAAAPIPDGAFAHLLWQTVAGSWPIERERLHAYAEKAAREASTSTCWDDPDPAFEQAMHDAIDRIYDRSEPHRDVASFARVLAPFGYSNSLGQKLVQLTMPGVPDTYQGCELWDFSLVDPDNRRPVDFAARRDLLDRLDSGWLPPVDDSGAAKLMVVSRALRLRRDFPELFASYRPVLANGPAADHVVAFDRGGAVTVVTRLPLRLALRGGLGDTTLPLPWPAVDALTARRYPAGPVPLHELLWRYPVALLAPA
ncbi:MAG TPA: malto-oligosyltrehalose synthase [Mycobacteriales bacterium]|nr:malto-oligosyltrehalose synthase [Mycobacteriales bacterium]